MMKKFRIIIFIELHVIGLDSSPRIEPNLISIVLNFHKGYHKS